ncbi:acyltransferase family protein [Serratia fonticola]|uniref:acyltransferase family protein n=1 Tax=Serratia fonticola TaxID=47917 RepID=UPI00093A9700|nr:acyltransferase family protein [Serratia fonticola]OKP29374.1 hypothetical protein BSQ40_09125 [Serratia fonticola]
MNFRLDINGLRFIAVAMVVLFHFKFSAFYGGYAGVDVFFVISGFLMQEICNKEIGIKNWAINFYRKRFKRIYPALLVMVIFTFILALYSETPSGLNSFVDQSISALTFTSNLYYLNQSGGYFSTSSDFNWLLHTWSLSLEWQYYLIFPLIIKIGTLLRSYRNIFYIFIILSSFSLCFLVGIMHLGDKALSANFYILPTRAWELMIGAYVSVSNLKNKAPKTTELSAIACLILFTIFVSDSSAWPSALTLIPVLSAAAIIHANLDNARTIFKSKSIQYIGSASYSIYLFHWPVVSFMANNSIEFTLTNSAIGLALSIALGAISYRYFERLFVSGFKYIVVTLSVFVVLSVSFARLEVNRIWVSEEVMALDGFKNYAATNKGVEQFGNAGRICFLTTEYDDISLYQKDVCLKKSEEKKNILLVGDSHAAELYSSMRDVFKEYNVMQATASGCMPFDITTGSKRCTDLINYIYNDYLKNNNIDYVFISANWVTYNKGDILNRLNAVSSLIGHDKVFIIGQTKVFSTNFYRIAQKVNENKIEELVTPSSIEINNILSKNLNNNVARYIDIFNLNCNEDKCRYFDEHKEPMLFDQNHLTKDWADSYVKYVREKSGI